MNKSEFAIWCSRNVHVLDGATGSNLQKMGMPSDVCPEKWIADNPEKLIQLQRGYVEAGSDIIYAPTFGANRIKLSGYFLENETVELNKKLVELSKSAADGKAYVAGDMTMTGEALAPLGTLTMETLIETYAEQAKALAEAGADFIIVETMISIQEVRAAIIAIRSVCSLPILVSMTFEENGRTLYGTEAKTALLSVQQLGADAFGTNCGSGPAQVSALIKELSAFSKIPLIAKPNAGLPEVDADGKVYYCLDEKQFASEMEEIAANGVNLIGGCCGTTPSYIKEISRLKNTDVKRHELDELYFTSERNYISVSDAIISPQINISELPDVFEDIEDEIYDSIIEAVEKEMDEFDVIMLNLNGVDPAVAAMIVAETGQLPGVFLGFSADSEEVLEAALLAYPGIAAYKNEADEPSLNGIALKYGAIKVSE